jgi:adenosine deaminase-related growth factor
MGNRGIILILLLIWTSSQSLGEKLPEYLQNEENYFAKRAELLVADNSMKLSNALNMNKHELLADSVLSLLKRKYLHLPPGLFPPANRFHEVRNQYDKMQLLEIMKRLPKGGLLHCHPTATGAFTKIIEATYVSEAYYFNGFSTIERPKGSIGFFEQDPEGDWLQIVKMRKEYETDQEFDAWLLSEISLGHEDYDLEDIWSEFENNFGKVWGVLSQPGFIHEYLYEMCLSLAENRVQYAEFRTFIGSYQNSDGSYGGTGKTVEYWISVRDSVRLKYPAFDLKLINSNTRWNNPEVIGKFFIETADLMKEYPDMVIGFDLVSEEDKTHTNVDYLTEFIEASKYAESIGVELTPYPHAGESNRPDNINLYDVILMGAKRIGHGFALTQHPELMKLVKEKDICIEVCPISNQALRYVEDLRNHPARQFLVYGIPFVLSPDDPGMMGYEWSYDWLAATLAWDMSLGDIKQLIINSFRYSGMDEDRCIHAEINWMDDWNEFVLWLSQYEVKNRPTKVGEKG